MLTFQTETLDNILPFIQSMARAHWDEVEASLHGQQHYTIDEKTYKQLESLHMLHITTAKNEQGLICGYAAFTISSSHHRADETIASLDAFYLAPWARKGLNALQLLRVAEQALLKRSVQLIQFSSPVSRPCDALYRRMGAKQVETIYHKRLL